MLTEAKIFLSSSTSAIVAIFVFQFKRNKLGYLRFGLPDIHALWRSILFPCKNCRKRFAPSVQYKTMTNKTKSKRFHDPAL